jgi:hypothetical protein
MHFVHQDSIRPAYHQHEKYLASIAVFRALQLKICVFCVVRLCRWVSDSRSFERTSVTTHPAKQRLIPEALVPREVPVNTVGAWPSALSATVAHFVVTFIVYRTKYELCFKTATQLFLNSFHNCLSILGKASAVFPENCAEIDSSLITLMCGI